jgi:hypothetical protein
MAIAVMVLGNASAGINIYSVGFRYQFNAPPPPVVPLMTKG